MELNLTIKDRAVLPTVLPEKGSLLEQRMVRGITKAIEFTPKEEEEYQIQYLQNGQLAWNSKGNKEEAGIDVKFSTEQFQLIKQSLRKLDEDGKVTQLTVALCDKVLN